MNKPSDEKSSGSAALAPWAHPKAKKWFDELFAQSGLVMKLRDVLDNPEQPISPSEARLLMSVITILGHKGVWPSDQRKDLQRLGMKLGNLARKKEDDETGKPLTMEQHRQRQAIREEVENELEFLRRITGMSNRVSDIFLPKSWGQFWT